MSDTVEIRRDTLVQLWGNVDPTDIGGVASTEVEAVLKASTLGHMNYTIEDNQVAVDGVLGDENA